MKSWLLLISKKERKALNHVQFYMTVMCFFFHTWRWGPNLEHCVFFSDSTNFSLNWEIFPVFKFFPHFFTKFFPHYFQIFPKFSKYCHPAGTVLLKLILREHSCKKKKNFQFFQWKRILNFSQFWIFPRFEFFQVLNFSQFQHQYFPAFYWSKL